MKEKLGFFVRSGAPETEKFDMYKPITYQPEFLLKTLVWPLCTLRRAIRKGKVTKVRMDGLKSPFILICNHNAFYDFYVLESVLKPYTAVFPAAVDDFIAREPLLRLAGGLPKRKYTSDLNTVRQCQEAIKNGHSFGIYAEARYSLCGVTEYDAYTESIGQLVKLMKVPCVVLNCKGHHLYDPFWGNHMKRDIMGVECVMTQIFTAEEVEKASVEEINAKIDEYLYNDDWRWQSENRVTLKYKKRAQGLHKPLYQCPHCMTEYKMNSKDDTIFCEHCGKSWWLNYYGELEASDGNTEFKFPSDWYAWEREQVKKEIQEGRYYFECDCHVNELPNAKGFVRLGRGKFVHDMNGLRVEGIRDYDKEPFSMKLDAASQHTIHVEYKYRFGNFKDCIDMNTLQDTWYVFPENCEFSVTKISLATEQIYKEIWRKRNEEKENAKKEKAE